MLGFRGLLLSLLPLTLAAAAGCSNADDGATSADDITDVRHTPVKEQTIGNCWLYASVAWAESLHASATGETRDLSESYLTYWNWYEKIKAFQPTATEPKLQTGGFFNEATHLMTTYGLMNEGSFIRDDETRASSQRQRAALAKIEAALKPEGRLATGAQRTPKNIRAVLNDAFELAPEVRSDLDAAFGAEDPAPLARGRSIPERIIAPWTFELTSKAPGQPATKKPLDVVTAEWEEAYLYGNEADSRGTLRRMQKTLHDALPALVVWQVDFASSANDGNFKKRPTSKLDKWDGAHMTVVEDYQAFSVPGFGTLPVGVPVTEPAALDAALANQSRIGLIRIKNSWGFKPSPSGDDTLKGYYDLHNDYLFGMHALTSVIVPRAYDASAPAGQADVCATGGSQRSGTYCARSITNDASDARLLTCSGGVSTSVQDCTQGCQQMPAGTPDKCKEGPPPNPCATGAASGPGKYCGKSLGLALSAPGFSNLYSCQKDPATGQLISPFVACPRGCRVNPPGVPDACNP